MPTPLNLQNPFPMQYPQGNTGGGNNNNNNANQNLPGLIVPGYPMH